MIRKNALEGEPVTAFPLKHVYLSIIVLFGCMLLWRPFNLAHAESATGVNRDLQYYDQMSHEEFVGMMLPKERYLLFLIQQVNEEISRRRKEDSQSADFGIEAMFSTREKLLQAYQEELERMLQLIREIEDLERRAKRQTDLESLNALNALRVQIGEMIDLEQYAPESTQETDESSNEKDSNPNQRAALSSRELYKQWKTNRILDYKLKRTRYEYLRTKLINTGTRSQRERMFKQNLLEALEAYSNGDFVQSRLLLNDILETYGGSRVLDDVLYYATESAYALNYLDEALAGYYRLIQDYPTSEFYNKSLIKILNIFYIYGDQDRLIETYDQISQRRLDLGMGTWSTVSYLIGHGYFREAQFVKAIQTLNHVRERTTYYYPAQYLKAACYSNLNDNQDALKVYVRLLEAGNGSDDPILAQIQNNALLKLGLIYYEMGEDAKALAYLNQVSTDFKYYDLSLMGRAWSAYRAGRPGEALFNVESLLQDNIVSSYSFEASVLAARSKELLGQREEALDDLKHLYDMGNPSSNLGYEGLNASGRTRSSREDLSDAGRETLEEALGIRDFLKQSAGVTGEETQYSNRLNSQMDAASDRMADLDRLESEASARNDVAAMTEIRKLRSILLQTFEDHSGSDSQAGDEDPLSEQMGTSNYLQYLFRSLINEIQKEKKTSNLSLLNLQAQIEQIDTDNRFDALIDLEIQKDELEEYYLRLNQYEVWLRENFPEDYQAELSQWTQFSGYGISNITFSRIKQIESQVTQIAMAESALDRVYRAKQAELEGRIQALLDDVARIEKQMSEETQKQEERERERFFQKDYFDKQTREPISGQTGSGSDRSRESVK